MGKTCQKCGRPLEAGSTTAIGLIGTVHSDNRESRLLFVVPGQRTSANPVRAFQQGLAEQPGDRAYRIRGFRCSQCGALELYADEEVVF